MISFKPAAIVAVIILSMAAIIYYQHDTIQEVKRDRDTYQNNTYGLLTDIEALRKDSLEQAYQIQTLSFTVDEYKAYRAEDLNTIKSLQLKLKNIQSVSKQSLEVNAPIVTPIVKHLPDSVSKPITTVKLENTHISFIGTIKNDSLVAKIQVPIQLTQIIHKVPRHKFLWWSWGCKAIKQVIVTNNPYVNLNYSEYIELR